MSRKVIISKTAEKKLSSLFQYLHENWSAQVKSNFIEKLDHNIDIINQEPETFPESQKDLGFRKGVITKQTTDLTPSILKLLQYLTPDKIRKS